MVGDDLQGDLPGLVFAQCRRHTPVGRPPLRLQHGFVGHPLKQGVPELVLDFGAVPAGKQNLRFHQRLQRFSHGFRLLLQQSGEENRRK